MTTLLATIDDFRGEYRFLSNFFPVDVEFEGVVYPSVEHAYQAAKTLDATQRTEILHAQTAGAAKRMGQAVTLRADWNDMRESIMRSLVTTKFKVPELRRMLVDTGNAILVEGNTWHDNFFGQCVCKKCGMAGANVLGKILMDVRKEITE